MKKLVLLAGLFTTSLAQANENLPILSNMSIEAFGLCDGPICPMVMPKVEIRFNYASCSIRSFKLVEEIGTNGIATITVQEVSNMDCFGPEVVRSYQLDLNSFNKGVHAFVVKNPITY